ncbi:PREDICTED: F-box protein At3g61340-like [Camelina sativa]|uniref:F-box protein At3g61340-like n=1 Tax=Camelina sativa TaxID=90675 RepID=A0ABM0WNT9_CAMSA|nr:PREDICTED: F-box protein At3g61340-like [Camelina sativa]
MMTRRKTRSCSKPRNEEVVKPEPIPFDLVIEVLLRLPVRSVARCRSVSKLWNSTLEGPHFTESFFTLSSFRPKILFTCLKGDETVFFSSSPNPQDLSIAANIRMSFPINSSSHICRPVRGWLCGLHRTTKGATVTVPLVCNPSTGESVPLPTLKTRRKVVITFFGYDPIVKTFKALCMTRSSVGGEDSPSGEHQVLTLGTGKTSSSREMIDCHILHHPAVVEETNGFCQYDAICINGVLYYLAVVHDVFEGHPDIVCFEFESKKFSYIKKADHSMGMYSGGYGLEPTLVNYKGKLAKLQPSYSNVDRICNGIQLLVLEDAVKHQWSSYIYILPPPWMNLYGDTKLCFVGTTSRGEIVLSSNTISRFFYLLYYSPERNTIQIVKVKGLETFKGHKAYIFLDHVEDVKLVPKKAVT